MTLYYHFNKISGSSKAQIITYLLNDQVEMKGVSCSAWHQVSTDALIFTQLTVPQLAVLCLFLSDLLPPRFKGSQNSCGAHLGQLCRLTH